MISVLESGAGGPGLSADRGHCVVFFGKTLVAEHSLRARSCSCDSACTQELQKQTCC